MINKIEVSHKTIIFTALFFISIWLVVQIKDIILLLFVSFILVSAISPVVEKLEKMRIHRAIAIFVVYILGLGLIAIVGTLVVPPLVTQTIKLATRLPEFVNTILPDTRLDLNTIFGQVVPVGSGIVRFSVGVFSNLISIITLLVVTFYFLLERKNLDSYLSNFLGTQLGKKTYLVIAEIENRLGAWVRGELALMTIIGVLTFIGLFILRVDYALPLAIFAGAMEIIPIIGPIISAVPAVLVAASISPPLALVVVVLYTLIQQLENSLVVPSVMRKAVGLPPLVTILSLMVGGRLAGIGGALLSVPVVVVLRIILGHLLFKK